VEVWITRRANGCYPRGVSESRPWEFALGAGICTAIVVLAATTLVAGGLPQMVLPIGPAGMPIRLTLDPLAASFLLLAPCMALAPVPLAGIVLTLSAANGFTLAIGVMMVAGLAASRPAVVAVVCLIVALGLAGSVSDFAAIQAMPPDGWRAAAVLLLTLAGAAAAASFSPAIAMYAMLRLLFDLCGAGQPFWWGMPLVLAGGLVATVAALRAALAGTLHEFASHAAAHPFGLALTSLGVALVARAVDLPSLASHALSATWLALVCHLLCRTLLLRCADAVERGAGTRRIDRLGGVIHGMPVTAGAWFAGLFSVAVLPPSLGFAALWLVFQSLLAAARIGGLGLGLLITAVAILVGCSVGLVALAALRLGAVALLGGPRTPRAAGADEAPRAARLTLVGLAALIGLLGVMPGMALLPAASWTNAATAISPLGLRIGSETPGYASIFVAALIAIVWIVLARLRRPILVRREPPWSGGFAVAAPWKAFGDPGTQISPDGFVAPLHSALSLLPAADPMRQRLRSWRAALRSAITALVAT
jgi:formate hydrogenlyase subunit 3/multisubunit Na+/H+ antiporter MnhD subunit